MIQEKEDVQVKADRRKDQYNKMRSQIGDNDHEIEQIQLQIQQEQAKLRET